MKRVIINKNHRKRRRWEEMNEYVSFFFNFLFKETAKKKEI